MPHCYTNSRRNQMEMLIYKIINIKNKHIYIGKCKNLAKRWTQHKGCSKYKNTDLYFAMRKYGIKNFKIKIIEYCNKNNVNRKEKLWISKLKPKYNMTKGGDGGGFLNKKHNKNWLNKIKNINSKKVACYDLDGNFIKVFNSYTEAGSFIGKTKNHKGVSACIRGEYKSCGGFQWKSIKNNNLPKKIKSYKRISHKQKKVIQYDIDNTYIKTYKSITEAANITGSSVSKIVCVCKKQRKQHNGFIWKYSSC